MPTLKLTKPVIDDLKPKATDQVYWDKSLPGFGLKVTPDGLDAFPNVRAGNLGDLLASFYAYRHLSRPVVPCRHLSRRC